MVEILASFRLRMVHCWLPNLVSGMKPLSLDSEILKERRLNSHKRRQLLVLRPLVTSRPPTKEEPAREKGGLELFIGVSQ